MGGTFKKSCNRTIYFLNLYKLNKIVKVLNRIVFIF